MISKKLVAGVTALFAVLLLTNGVLAGQSGVSYPLYSGGERNGPLEDCGGIPRFYELLDAIADPSHPSHAGLKEWAGDYDPNTFD